jgi:hypothetical protein
MMLVNLSHSQAYGRNKSSADPIPASGTVFVSKFGMNVKDGWQHDGAKISPKYRRLLPHNAERYLGMWSAEKIPKL